MIISDENRYLFVELPLTGTSAISNELCRLYGGDRILKKHSTYETFLAQATPHQRDYFSFSCIRNPMDAVVSQYFKLKTDHFNFAKPDKMAKRNRLNRLIYARRRLDQLRFIRDNDADFATYFLKFFRSPYSNWSVLSHHDLDFIIRFEWLEKDFEVALGKIGLQLSSPLPVRNKTSERTRDYLDYYPEHTRERAKIVFRSFMSEWGYEFPKEWGEIEKTLVHEIWYRFLNAGRKYYWSHLKHDF